MEWTKGVRRRNDSLLGVKNSPVPSTTSPHPHSRQADTGKVSPDASTQHRAALSVPRHTSPPEPDVETSENVGLYLK